MQVLNNRIYFCDFKTLVRSGLLSESILSGFGQETASEKSPFCNLLSELIYLKLKRCGWRQVNNGNRL